MLQMRARVSLAKSMEAKESELLLLGFLKEKNSSKTGKTGEITVLLFLLFQVLTRRTGQALRNFHILRALPIPKSGERNDDRLKKNKSLCR